MEEQPQIQQRQIAYLVKIKDLLDGQYTSQEGMLPDYVKVAWGQHVSRVNLLGTVVDRNAMQLLLDDGSGTLPLRFFDPIPGFDEAAVGQVLLVIGKIREYQGERYVLAETLQQMESAFLKLRAMQLEKFTSSRSSMKLDADVQELDEIEEETSGENPVLAFIIQHDKGEGVAIDLISEQIAGGAKDVDRLLMSGDIFEIRPGVVKVLG